MGLFTIRFTHCSIECDECSDGEIVNTGDMGTRTVEDVKKYWRSEGWRIGKVTLYQQAENIWWFDLKEAHSKRKPLKKSKHSIKALRS